MIYGNLVVSDRKGNTESYKLEVSFIQLKIILSFLIMMFLLKNCKLLFMKISIHALQFCYQIRQLASSSRNK